MLIPNLLYNSLSCQLTHPLGDICTSLWLFQNTRAAAQWPVNFPLYSTTMAEPFSAFHHRMLFLPVHLRMKFDVLPPNAVTPLSASSHVYKSPSATEFCWSVWNQELIVRKHAFQNIKQKNAWDIIKQSVSRCLPVLPYAPMYWIRDLLLKFILQPFLDSLSLVSGCIAHCPPCYVHPTLVKQVPLLIRGQCSLDGRKSYSKH